MEINMKNVVITGSSNGFGESAAKIMADSGYRVWATMRESTQRNAQKKEALESYSDKITVVEMDVTEDESVRDAFSIILQEIEKVDVLINNAGIMYTGITEAFSVEQAHTQMNTNYYGAIRATQAVLPGMRKAGNGLIINVSSIAGRIAVPYFGTYCATKFALEAYSQSLRYEVAPCGVDITLVEPGPFSTGLFAAIKQPERSDVIDSYGELKNVPDTLFAGFGEMLKNGEFPDPKLVVDAYLSLAESEPSTRPMRTQVGVSWGVDELNRMSQPIQDNILEGLQIADYLGGVSQ